MKVKLEDLTLKQQAYICNIYHNGGRCITEDGAICPLLSNKHTASYWDSCNSSYCIIKRFTFDFWKDMEVDLSKIEENE